MSKLLKETIFAVIIIAIVVGTVFGVFGSAYNNSLVLFIAMVVFVGFVIISAKKKPMK